MAVQAPITRNLQAISQLQNSEHCKGAGGKQHLLLPSDLTDSRKSTETMFLVSQISERRYFHLSSCAYTTTPMVL
jgi:hypothetical protein